MKVKVPREIKIGTYTANVGYKKYIKTDDGWRACYNQRTGELHVDPDIGVLRDRSFLHEIIHIINFNYECDLSESNISRLANGLTEFLAKNLGIELDWGDIDERL